LIALGSFGIERIIGLGPCYGSEEKNESEKA